MKINFFLNHIFCTVDTDPLRSLADVLRNDFNQTDVKQGCKEGECGACAVLIEELQYILAYILLLWHRIKKFLPSAEYLILLSIKQ